MWDSGLNSHLPTPWWCNQSWPWTQNGKLSIEEKIPWPACDGSAVEACTRSLEICHQCNPPIALGCGFSSVTCFVSSAMLPCLTALSSISYFQRNQPTSRAMDLSQRWQAILGSRFDVNPCNKTFVSWFQGGFNLNFLCYLLPVPISGAYMNKAAWMERRG